MINKFPRKNKYDWVLVKMPIYELGRNKPFYIDYYIPADELNEKERIHANTSSIPLTLN